MKILIIGEQPNLEQCKVKFGKDHEYTLMGSVEAAAPNYLNFQDIIFDFTIDENVESIELYASLKQDVALFLNAVKVSLAELIFYGGELDAQVFGFNGLPTFFERDILEVSTLTGGDPRQSLPRLGVEYQLVDDRVGMATPRVIFMIINEAYYTVQEGTASREDIDTGMKLGTNYPYGPFEWSKKIGLNHVYETLEAIYEDTKDGRYKICPLLKKEYLLLP